MTDFGLWEKEHALSFVHPEYGSLIRTQHGEWEQVHVEFGRRVLKAESLKDALIEAETPYKQEKSKIKVVKRLRKVIKKDETQQKEKIKPRKTTKKKKKAVKK